MKNRHYLVLLIFVSVGGLGAAYERWQPAESASLERARAMSTLVERYPERPVHLYYRGVWALERGDVPTAQSLFARAIDQDFFANEGLLHHHARLLVQGGAPAGEVDRAVHLWEKHFPNSRNPNPREYAKESDSRR